MSDAAVSRRDFLKAAAGVATALSGCAHRRGDGANARRLNIFNWADYLHPDVVPEFERRYGIEVTCDTYASNEALLAKMQAGGSRYDIIVPTGYNVRHLRKLGLIKALDKEKIKGFHRIMPRFKDPAFDPGCRYSVPFMWGSTGIGYNRSAFAASDEPYDWDVFWDRGLAGRMTLLDDARETLGMALKRRGHSYNTTAEPLLKTAVNDLIAQKPLTMAYTSDQVIIQLASGDSLLSLVYSGDAYQARRANPQVSYVIPASGASIWVDSWCIPESAPHVENAYLWINFMLEPEIAARTADYVGYATPNMQARLLVSPELRADRNLYPGDELLDKCEEIGDVGAATFLYDRMWTELKCA